MYTPIFSALVPTSMPTRLKAPPIIDFGGRCHLAVPSNPVLRLCGERPRHPQRSRVVNIVYHRTPASSTSCIHSSSLLPGRIPFTQCGCYRRLAVASRERSLSAAAECEYVRVMRQRYRAAVGRVAKGAVLDEIELVWETPDYCCAERLHPRAEQVHRWICRPHHASGGQIRLRLSRPCCPNAGSNRARPMRKRAGGLALPRHEASAPVRGTNGIPSAAASDQRYAPATRWDGRWQRYIAGSLWHHFGRRGPPHRLAIGGHDPVIGEVDPNAHDHHHDRHP